LKNKAATNGGERRAHRGVVRPNYSAVMNKNQFGLPMGLPYGNPNWILFTIADISNWN